MTLHTIMATVLTHPLQVLCIGILVARGVDAVMAAARAKWRLLDAGNGPVPVLVVLDARLDGTAGREPRRFTDLRRLTATDATVA